MMLRLFCLSSCVVFALSVAPLFSFAEEVTDPFGPVGSSVDESPFDEGQQGEPSATERPVLTADPLPGAADTATSENLCRCIGQTESESVAKIEQALRRKLTSTGIDFNDAPLEEVVAFLQETYDIPIQLDMPALDDVGIGPDEPVTINVRGISLQSALRLLLNSIQSTFIIQNEVLLITSPETAESELTTCVYDVRDLVHVTRKGVDFDSLIDTIVSCIAPESWAENGGGESDIRPLQPGFLVISQSWLVHEEIGELLNSIRELKSRPVAAAVDAGANASLDELVTEWNRRQ